MGFWDIFARRRADPSQQVRYLLPYPVAGINITPDEALQVSAVWACVDVIAKAVASCEWNVFKPIGNGRREQMDDDALSYVLNTRANADMTAIGFREAMLYVAIPFGNAYAEIVPKVSGQGVAELWPLEPERVTPRRDLKTNDLYYEYRELDGGFKRLEAKQVFHLRGPSITGLVGENIVARAVKSISVAAAADRYSAAFFGRGASPTGVLEYPGKFSKEQFDRLKEDWAEKKQGPENAHKPLILEGGMKWNPTSIEPGKSQLVESRQFSVEEICRWFGVPPHKVQHLLRATFSNIEHLSIEFVRDALTPWCRRLEQEADFKLFPMTSARSRLFTKIDTAPLSYGDALSRAQAHAVWRQNGIMSANEIRRREGLNDAGDDGDVLLVQSNLTTVEKLVTAPAPTAPSAPATAPDSASLDPNIDDASSATARQGLTIFMSSALERYERRIANRRADIQKRLTPPEVENHLMAERQKLRPWLAAELEPAADLAVQALGRNLSHADLAAAADLVDRGATPLSAATRALSTAAASIRP
jgi:HK97 family phage portal protein